MWPVYRFLRTSGYMPGLIAIRLYERVFLADYFGMPGVKRSNPWMRMQGAYLADPSKLDAAAEPASGPGFVPGPGYAEHQAKAQAQFQEYLRQQALKNAASDEAERQAFEQQLQLSGYRRMPRSR